MDMAIGEGADGGDSLGSLDRVKLSSVDMEGRPALRPPRVAYFASMVIVVEVCETVEWVGMLSPRNHES